MYLPRVTEILKPFTNFDNVPKNTLAKAAVRGTTVHSICAGIAKGNWIGDELIDSEYLGYIKSFKQWSEAQVKEYIVIEKRYVDEDLMYTGQVDYVITGNDDNYYLVDIKTSATKHKTYPLQMAAYNGLLNINGINVHSSLIVYLDKNGEFPDIQCIEDMKEDYHVFLSALECWQYFNKGKRNGKIRRSKES